MLFYDLTKADMPIYEYLYNCIKNDILYGKIAPGEKLPSKRNFAKNHGISTITVQNAYDQLISEGYITTVPKRGYYAAVMEKIPVFRQTSNIELDINIPKEPPHFAFDFASNRSITENFPFSVWAKVMRETISLREKELLDISPCCGILQLREAIAGHLSSFRGMGIDPNQIVVGAGTEYLYGILIDLLGKEKVYGIENPGYTKLKQIYGINDVRIKEVDMDENGIVVEYLRNTDIKVAHISPTHHFPTGITMPISRRYEILAWANESADRYIIEDDYDSEFRINGKPIPTLQSIDACEKVIYMNTFSKSLASTIRISYMVLPRHLANLYYEKMSFMSCTVSTFEQYTLAEFIKQGYFEKHINRMRLHYGRKRTQVLEIIRKVFKENECKIIENDSGLHFVMELKCDVSDEKIKRELLAQNIRISSVMDYYRGVKYDRHQFILNYSNINVEKLEDALVKLKKAMF